MTKRGETTRRGFIAAIGAGAAALAVPVGAVAAGPARFAAGSWRQAVAVWPAAVETMKAQTDAIVAQFRPAYLAEVERLAEELRPRFMAGDLRAALGEADARRDEEAQQEARDRIETLGAERFGVQVERTRDANGYLVDTGDETLGAMICKVSPSAPQWEVDGDWNHICFAAEACIGSDLLAVARREGWGVRS